MHVHPCTIGVVAHLGARAVAAPGQLVGQPQLFLAARFFGNAVLEAFTQQFFIGLAQRCLHGQVRAQVGHEVVAQHQPVVLVIDIEAGGHGVHRLVQAALCAFGVGQRLFQRAFLVHGVGDVGAQHHHAATVERALGQLHPAVAPHLLHFGAGR